MMAETKEFISKGRLDALTDGVFAFAMTLLVVNLDLPEDFHPSSAEELISALLGLGGTLIAYVITFLVLATFWLGRARTKEEPESASGAYAWSVLFHLFFVTLLPFSMIVAGRYNLAPAIWIYGANMILLALTAFGFTLAVERDIQRAGWSQAAVPNTACWSLRLFSRWQSASTAQIPRCTPIFLNFASPLVRRWTERV
jgi:TMEM175 potassium channel family protein